MRVYLTFYKTLALPLIAISIICAYQVWQSQSVYFIFRVLWVKVLTSLVIATYIILFRTRQFVFYNNLGYSRSHLFAVILLFDFLVWLSLMVSIAYLL